MINVISPGFFTTVQDEGRWGYQGYGMPVAGAMDRFACRVANCLAGNPNGAAVLEMTMKGGVFRFEQDCQIAVCGADMLPELDGVAVKNWTSFAVKAGSELSFSFAVSGCRTYLAVRGDIDVPRVLGSRSTYTRAFIGGMEGRMLKAGDLLLIGTETAFSPCSCVLPDTYIPRYDSAIRLRVLPGPQDDLFEDSGIAAFFENVYTITDEADRMGYRLEGAKISHKGKADIVSDALCQGAVQVPGHGMPIIMMADRQTTGGYAKLGTVIGPDLPLLAQAKPGDTVRFVRCSDEEAVAALREEQVFYQWLAAFVADKAGANGNPALRRSFQVVVDGQAYQVEIQERME